MIKAHQDNEGENVVHRHVVHVAKLRYGSIDAIDGLRACFRGVVGEHKTLLETAGEELVRDGGTCQGVQEKDFGPDSGATVKGAGEHTNEHMMKWREILRFGLKKLPKPVLEDCFRSFAVTGAKMATP